MKNLAVLVAIGLIALVGLTGCAGLGLGCGDGTEPIVTIKSPLSIGVATSPVQLPGPQRAVFAAPVQAFAAAPAYSAAACPVPQPVEPLEPVFSAKRYQLSK
jgi:hypothetical protein